MPLNRADEAFSNFQALSTSVLASWQADPLTASQCSTIADLTQQIASAYREVKTAEGGNGDQLRRSIFKLLSLTQDTNLQVEQIVAASVSRESPSPEVQREIRRSQILLLVLGLAASMVTAMTLAYLFSRYVTTELSVLLNNSKRLVKGLPPTEASQGTDELAQLDAAFHSMAAKLTAARTQERAFLDNSMDLIFALDENLRFCAVSRAIVPLTGFGEDSFMNASVLGMVPDAERQKVLAVFEQVKVDGSPQRFETPILQSVHRLDASLSVAWSADEELFLCVARDISKRKELERIKEEFVGFVSHDLRSPLSTILALTSLLEAEAYGSLSPESLQLTNRIRRNCNDLIELVNDLLDLQKLSSGAMDLVLVRLDSDAVLDLAVSMLTSEVDQNRIVLDIPIDSPKVNADLERLARAFAGLLAELSSLGPAAITITLQQTSAQVAMFNLRYDGSSEPDARNNLLQSLNSPDDVFTGPSGLSRLRILLSLRLFASHGAAIEAICAPEGTLSLIVRIPIAD